MTIQPITPTTPACYGITCPKRRECNRYVPVEEPSEHQTISCCEDRGEFPLFLALPKTER